MLGANFGKIIYILQSDTWGKRDSVKTSKVAFIVSFLMVILVSLGSVSAANTTISATANAFWSPTPTPGSLVELTVNFESSNAVTIYLYRIGIHVDWQAEGQYYTLDLSDNPKAVEGGGLYSTKVTITVPATASIGPHTYMIAVDGFDNNGDSFTWDSASYSITVQDSTTTTTTPTSTNNSTSRNGAGIDSLLIYIAVIAGVAVIAVLLAIFIVKRTNKKIAAPVVPYTPERRPPPETDEPEEKAPEQDLDEKDFTI